MRSVIHRCRRPLIKSRVCTKPPSKLYISGKIAKHAPPYLRSGELVRAAKDVSVIGGWPVNLDKAEHLSHDACKQSIALIRKCDVYLAFITDADQLCTINEIGWAAALKKPMEG